MKLLTRSLLALTLTGITATAFATAPAFLTTHNNTENESNAFIAGTIPSPYATPAHSTRQIYWNMVRIACFGNTTNGKCTALIKMSTNTSAPLDIGYVTLNLDNGDITPKQVSSHGYTVIINGPGEATINKD